MNVKYFKLIVHDERSMCDIAEQYNFNMPMNIFKEIDKDEFYTKSNDKKLMKVVIDGNKMSIDFEPAKPIKICQN